MQLMPSSDHETEQLLDKADAGDVAAVNQLLAGHRSRLRAMIRLRLDPRVAGRIDPSDVVQEALLEAHRRLGDYLRDRPLPFYPWLRKLAWERLVHLHQKHLVSGKRSVGREIEFTPLLSGDSVAILARRLIASDNSPSHQVLQAELQARVRTALERLSETDREVLVLRFMEQLSVEEIGDVLGMGESAVKMRNLRALERLRSLLAE
jgi:RNA polymerase sigma-70 factor (ECF subfamily)